MLLSFPCFFFFPAKLAFRIFCFPFFSGSKIDCLLPARASEQGNVIGLVSVYIYYTYIYMSSKKNCN